jgi:hypothetical protein
MRKIFTIVLLLISLSLSASHVHLSLTGVTTGTHFSYCQTTVDSVIVHKPVSSDVVTWYHPSAGYSDLDSIIVTQSNQGYWYFSDGLLTIEFYIDFVSIAPTEPWTVTDTTKCTELSIILKGQVTHQPDFTYTWSTGTGTQINVTIPGIYYVTVTGACGTVSDQIEVFNHPVPVPNLGADVVTCDGNTVTLDPGTFAGYAWSTSVSTPTIDVTNTGTYRITVTDDNGCKKSDTILITFVLPYPDEQICLVTVDTNTWKNKIMWEKTPDVGTEYYLIYKETGTNSYAQIGNVAANQPAEYIDLFSTPESHGDKYKITVLDTCENESAMSFYHKTINLTISSYGSTMGLIWDDYVDESGNYTPFRYYIYRGSQPNNMTLLDSVSGSFNSYNDVSVFDVYYYMIGVKKPSGCNTTKSTEFTAFSNKKDNSTLVSVNKNSLEIDFKIFPNPTKENLVVEISQNAQLEIFNSQGQLIKAKTLTEKKSDIDLSGISSGVYTLRIKTDKGIAVKKLIKE